MFPETVLTDRLRLERLSRETVDLFDLYRLASDTETVAEETKHLSWNPHETPKATWEFLTDVEERWDDAEGATYAVFPREGEDGAGEFAGTTGLDLEWSRRTGTLGVWLRKPFWGRGYSGERAGALLQLAFDRLDLDLVAVTHHVDNEKSRRAIEKYVDRCGGRREGVLRNWLVDDDGVRDAVRYSISQAEWREAVGDEREAEFVDDGGDSPDLAPREDAGDVDGDA